MDSEEKKDSVNTEQPEGAEQPKGSESPSDSKFKIKVDGVEQEVTLEELQNGYMRQSDYTRKTQELAKDKTPVQDTPNEIDDETQSALDMLREKGFIDKDYLENAITSMKTESEFEKFDSNFNGILSESQIQAVKQLKNQLNFKESFEEIAQKYGFIDEAKLNRAKGGRKVLGGGINGKSGPTEDEIAGPPPKWLRK